jgi:hypothetical protein
MVFTKYFGVCSGNSSVMPQKNARYTKNVSRETIAGGRHRPFYCNRAAIEAVDFLFLINRMRLKRKS